MPAVPENRRYAQAADKTVCTDCVCSGAQRAPCRLAACAAWILWREASSFVIARRPKADVAISRNRLRFCRGFPTIQSCTARFPRRFAPRNDTSGWCGGGNGVLHRICSTFAASRTGAACRSPTRLLHSAECHRTYSLHGVYEAPLQMQLVCTLYRCPCKHNTERSAYRKDLF